MADFRKCLLAFAVLALLSSFAVPASAQVSTSNLQCTFNAAVTPTVRAEGLAELVGDIVLDCTGGTSTPLGVSVPQANITVFLSTNLTSRITASNSFTEVLMIVDEPHSLKNPFINLTPCDPGNANLGICSITGTGSGVGTYDGTASRPNIYQARLTGVNQVTFFGVPIDPPGTAGHRIFRITNLRGNANQLGVSSTLIPTQITANISVSPFNLLPLNNPQQTVAFVARGLTTSVQSAVKFVQCNDANLALANNASTSNYSAGASFQNGAQFTIRFDEGFPAAFKEKNIQTHFTNVPSGNAYSYPADAAQDVPGSAYFSESGFEANGISLTGPTAATTVAGVTYAGSNINGYGPFFTTANTNINANGRFTKAGVADQGTRLYVNFASVPGGTQIFVPNKVSLVIPAAGSAVSGFAILVSTDANGAGAYSAASFSSANGLAPVAVSGGSGLAVYEILYTDPFNTERLNVPVTIAYAANVGNNLPAPGVQSTAAAGFAPLSNVGTASDSAPIPRFAPSGTPLNTYIVNKCSCNILFPFVTNTQGFDTGVAISNTSVDPFGTAPQTGLVTLNYYSGGTPPPAQTTNANVPAGQTLAFTLSGGGNFGIAATPSFQGYIIASAQFQYCHAFAYISAQGALPTAPGASEGYLGIILDEPGLPRTFQIGENKAH